MRHAVRSRRFGRSRSERAALVRSLAQALFRYERIQTTLPKAKEAQRAAEQLITRAKTGTLAARRHVESWLQDASVTHTLFSEIAPRFKQRAGGYTRVVHAGYRNGDGAQLAVLELVERKPEPVVKPPKKSKGQKKEAASGTAAEPAQKTKPKHSPEETSSKESQKSQKSDKESGSKKKPGFLGALRKFFGKGRPTQGD
ncbi:MAG: 50S ribosomal protein L17 [Candidatus Omnitrophica bacterium]|nr:50S ribosomal protein L17 [Candidatus Omnitrophota bacterium]